MTASSNVFICKSEFDKIFKIEPKDGAIKVYVSIPPISDMKIVIEYGDGTGTGKIVDDLTDVFIATYGETTIQELWEAQSSGKVIICLHKNSEMFLPLSQGHLYSDRYGYNFGPDVYGDVFSCDPNSKWSMTTVAELEGFAHASNHAAGGSDPITPESIGAVTTSGVVYQLALPVKPSTPIADGEEIPYSWEELNVIALSGEAADYVSVGAIKSVTLNEPVLGTTTHDVRIIGINQDNNQSITFQTKNCLSQYTTFGSNAVWIGSTARTECQNYYNAFPGKAAIKTVSKGTCPSTNSSRNGTPTYNDETVFLLSEREFGFDNYSPLSTANSSTNKAECTQGKNFAYSYYTSNATRIMYLGDTSTSSYGYPWERSRAYDSSISVCGVSNGGSAGYDNYYSNNSGFAPAFVIGNEEASKGSLTQDGEDITDKVKEIVGGDSSKVGDILLTARTDLGDSWALCNGDLIYKDQVGYDAVLPSLITPVLLTIDGYDSLEMRDTQRKGWIYFSNFRTFSNSSFQLVLLNYFTGEIHSASVDSIPNTSSQFLGLTWNGSQWVICAKYNSALNFYGSNDLNTWNLLYSYTMNNVGTWNTGYFIPDLIFDGSYYRTLLWTSGYQACYTYTFSSDFSTSKENSISTPSNYVSGIAFANGIVTIKTGNNFRAYLPDGTSLSNVPRTTETLPVALKISDSLFTFTSLNTSNTIPFYDITKPATSQTTITPAVLNSISGNAIRLVWTNDKQQTLYAYYTASSTSDYVIIGCKYEDVLDSSKYYIVKKGVELRWPTGQDCISIAHNDSQFYEQSSAKYCISGSTPQQLPTISSEKYYGYIKLKE